MARVAGRALLLTVVLLAGCSPVPDATTEPSPTASVSVPNPSEVDILDAATCPDDATIMANPPGAHLPAEFLPSSWVLCVPDGHGGVTRLSTRDAAEPLVHALALPDTPQDLDASCNAQYVTLPYLFAVNASGQAVHVWIPLELTCLSPRTEVVSAIDALQWN